MAWREQTVAAVTGAPPPPVWERLTRKEVVEERARPPAISPFRDYLKALNRIADIMRKARPADVQPNVIADMGVQLFVLTEAMTEAEIEVHRYTQHLAKRVAALDRGDTTQGATLPSPFESPTGPTQKSLEEAGESPSPDSEAPPSPAKLSGGCISGPVSVGAAIYMIIEAITKQLGARRGLCLLKKSEGEDQLQTIVVAGNHQARQAFRNVTVPVGSGVVGATFRSNIAVKIDECLEEEGGANVQGVCALICFPIPSMVGNAPRGVIQFERRGAPFTETEEAMINSSLFIISYVVERYPHGLQTNPGSVFNPFHLHSQVPFDASVRVREQASAEVESVTGERQQGQLVYRVKRAGGHILQRDILGSAQAISRAEASTKVKEIESFLSTLQTSWNNLSQEMVSMRRQLEKEKKTTRKLVVATRTLQTEINFSRHHMLRHAAACASFRKSSGEWNRMQGLFEYVDPFQASYSGDALPAGAAGLGVLRIMRDTRLRKTVERLLKGDHLKGNDSPWGKAPEPEEPPVPTHVLGSEGGEEEGPSPAPPPKPRHPNVYSIRAKVEQIRSLIDSGGEASFCLKGDKDQKTSHWTPEWVSAVFCAAVEGFHELWQAPSASALTFRTLVNRYSYNKMLVAAEALRRDGKLKDEALVSLVTRAECQRRWKLLSLRRRRRAIEVERARLKVAFGVPLSHEEDAGLQHVESQLDGGFSTHLHDSYTVTEAAMAMPYDDEYERLSTKLGMAGLGGSELRNVTLEQVLPFVGTSATSGKGSGNVVLQVANTGPLRVEDESESSMSMAMDPDNVQGRILGESEVVQNMRVKVLSKPNGPLAESFTLGDTISGNKSHFASPTPTKAEGGAPRMPRLAVATESAKSQEKIDQLVNSVLERVEADEGRSNTSPSLLSPYRATTKGKPRGPKPGSRLPPLPSATTGWGEPARRAEPISSPSAPQPPDPSHPTPPKPALSSPHLQSLAPSSPDQATTAANPKLADRRPAKKGLWGSSASRSHSQPIPKNRTPSPSTHAKLRWEVEK